MQIFVNYTGDHPGHTKDAFTQVIIDGCRKMVFSKLSRYRLHEFYYQAVVHIQVKSPFSEIHYSIENVPPELKPELELLLAQG